MLKLHLRMQKVVVVHKLKIFIQGGHIDSKTDLNEGRIQNQFKVTSKLII